MTRAAFPPYTPYAHVFVHENSTLCGVPGGEVGYLDWRERLNRNLSRPSTGKWEPLTQPDPRPQVIMLGADFLMHPRSIVTLRNLAR